MTLQFPQPLLGRISDLAQHAPQDPLKAKKFEILAIAFANFGAQTSTTVVHLLAKPKDYEQTKTQRPQYFTNSFNNLNVEVKAEPATLYDYKTSGPDFQPWVDFANIHLGGGVFGDGMLQEETMALQMPELADAAADAVANGYYTRGKGGEGVLESSPTPLVITNVHRTIELDHALYKDGWKNMSMAQLFGGITVLPTNQVVHILAVAVPKLPKNPTHQQQTDIYTIDDLFNTFVAAYQATKDVAKGNVRINTGPIGTGDFGHDKTVVYVMQHLAAQHVGVNLRYWTVKDTVQQDYDKVVKDIVKDHDAATDRSLSHLVSIAQKHLSQ